MFSIDVMIPTVIRCMVDVHVAGTIGIVKVTTVDGSSLAFFKVRHWKVGDGGYEERESADNTRCSLQASTDAANSLS